MNICIALDKAEKQLVEALNTVVAEYGLPCYLLEPIVGKLYRAVQDGKQRELAAAQEEEKDGRNT